jgi:NADH-quinone oxidoreductase subunit L
MLIPLVVLAILSVVGGWVNIGKRFENFLEPAFRTGAASTLAEAAPAAGRAAGEEGTRELWVTLTSILAAGLGFFLAWLLYYRRPELPSRIARSLNGLYSAVVHKYYVDELYAFVFVKPLIDGSRKVLWQGIDQGIIDATVNDAARGTRQLSDSLRRMESGNVRSYAGWIALGAAAVIAYMVWTALT